MKAVVVDYLGGVIAGRGADGQWLTLEGAADLPEQDLGRLTRWLLFLPETWREDRKRRWETLTGWRVTEDPDEAERAHESGRGVSGSTWGPGPDDTPLHDRLRAARLKRGLSQTEVGGIFGVSQRSVSHWEARLEPQGDERSRGKPIPRDLAPLILLWIESGVAPTDQELAARKTSRPGNGHAPI